MTIGAIKLGLGPVSDIADVYSNLATIYASSTWALSSAASGSGIFYNCRSLVGGNGKAYSSSAYGYARMVIDEAGQAGYLAAA